MPSLKSALPRIRKHAASGQSYVYINGQQIYLGKHGSRVAQAQYDRVVAEWLANGRRLPNEQDDISTVNEVILAYLKFAGKYYVKNGRQTSEVQRIKSVSKVLRRLFGNTDAAEFGPKRLKAVRQVLISDGVERKEINKQISRVKRMFKWAGAEEIVSGSIYVELQTVTGLKAGRTEAREGREIQPVSDAVVEQTLPHVSQVVGDMIRTQRLLGCRPGEICDIRPCDIDRSGTVWHYKPHSHKTQHHGKTRIIPIGPKAQAILSNYLNRAADSFCFSPAEADRQRRAQMHAARKTPKSCGNTIGTNRKSKPKRTPGDRYTAITYGRAIRRACEKIGIEHWRPNQLRHARATEIRKLHGLEAAQTVLGHSTAAITQIYAERDAELATAIAKESG